MKQDKFTYGGFHWWVGEVKDRFDPLKLGRIKVEVFGFYDGISKEDLFWAIPVGAITSASMSGVGQTPLGLIEGSHVFGFFMDGTDSQVPIVLGSIAGAPESPFKYSKEESDVNRLARNDKIDKTIVQKRKDSILTVELAFGGSWKEKITPYAAKYPYNHVHESESGHITEVDDTEGAERLLWWHKAGTFKEIHPDGTQVEKIVKDNYQLIAGDDFIHVKGNCNITVDGNAKILVKGNCDTEIKGNHREHIHGNYDLQIDGKMTAIVKGNVEETYQSNWNNTTSGKTKCVAAKIDLNP